MEAHNMAGHLIRRLHQISTQVFMQQTRDAGFDITPVQFAAMDAVRSNPGIDQARVATLIAYDRATIGGVIDRLVQKGIVTRHVRKTDRRAREINLTKQGQRVIKSLTPIVQSLQEDILSNLGQTEQNEFMTLAHKATGSRSK